MNATSFLGIIFNFFVSFLVFCEAHAMFPDGPYFSYTDQELTALRSLQISESPLAIDSFAKWDRVIYQLSEGNNSVEGGLSRMMAYLYAAQRDFALLSYQVAQQWKGNPDQMIAKIIQLFYQDFHPFETFKEDLYSQKVSDLVFSKIEERYRLEEAHLKEYPSLAGPNRWKEKPPVVGRRIGTCMPWLLTSLNEFQAPVPPGPQSIIWVYGIEQIKNDQAHLTPEQIRLIKYWAGELGPDSGNWFAIANQALKEKQLSMADFLLMRAVFAMGYTDSMIAVFDSKYTYWVMRPHMLDPQIIPMILVPKHPSYPSAHSVTSSAAAVILSHFFPHEKQKWQQLAIQAGNSRIWAGLHYVYDQEQGLIQGEKIGDAIIKKITQH